MLEILGVNAAFNYFFLEQGIKPAQATALL